MLKRRSGLPVGERADGESYQAPTGIMGGSGVAGECRRSDPFGQESDRDGAAATSENPNGDDA
jgi:hypothetical protein